jgi:predicted DNA-binding transcriptional regulator YafY
MTRWPGGAPLEQIRFAGANHLLVELAYQGSTRVIEPYALRRSQAGNLLVYAIRVDSGEVRSYRVDRIQGVRVLDRPYNPRYAVELSGALPVRTGWRSS